MVLGLADIPSSASICRLATAGPCPHLKCPSMGSASRNINGDVLAFTRPVYLGARSPGMVPGPFGSVPELRTAPLPAPHVKARSDSLSTNLERAPEKTQASNLRAHSIRGPSCRKRISRAIESSDFIKGYHSASFKVITKRSKSLTHFSAPSVGILPANVRIPNFFWYAP